MRRFDLGNLTYNRKTLYFILSIIFVAVLSLTVVYAALSVTLNIVGSSQITASNWDIHLENAVVKKGSVSTITPDIFGNNLSFFADLTKPGEFYEFSVDIVNDGTIDAMIDSVIKTPELTSEQAKYLKYEVSYQNGESISTKQTIKSKNKTPIKVRIEYRTDLSASNLPSAETNLSLKLTLVYVQSDGSGSSIPNNGANLINVVSGSGTNIGNEVCIRNECFYVISSDDTTVTMLSKYNLHVGNSVDADGNSTPLTNPTGIQDKTAKGYDGLFPLIGATAFSNTGSTYAGSIVEGYVNNYNSYLITQGVTPIEARLATTDELNYLGCEDIYYNCNSAPGWVYATSYWTGTAVSDSRVWYVENSMNFGNGHYSGDNSLGVRPVIVISRNLITNINGPTKIIYFSIDGVNYQAEDGMSWRQWTNSKYNTGGFELYNYCLYASNNNIVCNEYSITVIVADKEYHSSEMCE